LFAAREVVRAGRLADAAKVDAKRNAAGLV
jgi:hypothetical protein